MILLLIAIALLVLDWRQTLRIFREGWSELNPVIRLAHSRFGRQGVDGYFACCIASLLLVDAFYEHAVYVIAGIAVVQAVVVIRNLALGIKP